MRKLNLILVYNKDEDKILMCKREKEPYKGKFNLVGGKLEENENELEAAYRELEEETGITNKEIELVEEVNKLYWINSDSNFFDSNKFAGEGNIGHLVKQAKIYIDGSKFN